MKAPAIFFACLLSMGVYAQGYVDQQAIRPLVEAQNGSIDSVHAVKWQVLPYTGLSALEQYIDSLPDGHKGSRRYIIELANRITFDNLRKGMCLIIPGEFEEDYRAYSPYPFHYTLAETLPKLFIIDKYTQSFGAYEYGKLVHWGLVSTGRKNNLTPAGRYNFNWKAYYRRSMAAPPGEVWEMYWVFDFHAKYGIHVHQYSLPIAMPASHGCVRTSEADAIWNYNWANGWLRDKHGKILRNGTPVMVINNNPPLRPAQWKISGDEVISTVALPVSFDQVRLGTVAQRQAAWESGW